MKSALVVVAAFAISTAPSLADALSDCNTGKDPSVTIPACNQAISSGRFDNQNLALLHLRLGVAHKLQLSKATIQRVVSGGKQASPEELEAHRNVVTHLTKVAQLAPDQAGLATFFRSEAH